LFPSGAIKLSWNYTGNRSEIVHWEIYRKTGARPFNIYARITQAEMDNMIANGLTPNGGRSYVFPDVNLLPFAQVRNQFNGAGGGVGSGGSGGGGSGGPTPPNGGALGDLYSYQVRAIHEDGGRSMISMIVRVQL